MSSSHSSPSNGSLSGELEHSMRYPTPSPTQPIAQDLLAEALESHKHRFSMITRVGKIICIVLMGARDPGYVVCSVYC
jgi:hypothetical protein